MQIFLIKSRELSVIEIIAEQMKEYQRAARSSSANILSLTLKEMKLALIFRQMRNILSYSLRRENICT